MRIAQRAVLLMGLCVLPAFCVAAAEGFRPFVFIHASDTELGSPDLQGTVKRFGLLAERANALGADFVVITGDLMHDPTDEQLQAFQGCLKRFKMPVKLVPGNHDDRRLFEQNFGPRRYVFTHNNCDFVCLDSNDLKAHPTSSEPKGRELWEWLDDALGEAERQKRTHLFVVLHHPISDRAPLAELLAKHKVEAVLSGHLHVTRELPGKGFTTYVTPGTAKFRDNNGLGYRVFRVFEDHLEQQVVPLNAAEDR
ncbi:MAG TPA: metallophosphoesterase [Planctomycetota bacterium]|nr:metallophosphoesterase [Planctomycetota bacterium]HRR79934.1 metallophosphoesterase [Planctomycetota bacterium]HRT96473.1 metallophosphoesterase [Planctomycetota bacterium]